MLSKEDQYQLLAMYQCSGMKGVPETLECINFADWEVSYHGNFTEQLQDIHANNGMKTSLILTFCKCLKIVQACFFS